MTPKQLFDRYVKDALANFYDPVHLQIHPLADLLLPRDAPRETKGQALRRLLRDAVTSLRPPASVPYGRPEWSGYRVMWLRYVESCDRTTVCRELSLSRASFYRHHSDAIQAVCSILWARYRREGSSGAGERGFPADSSSPDRAQSEAVRVARSSHRQWVGPAELLEGVKHTIAPLVEEQGIRLRIDAPHGLPMLYGDPAVLRQIVLNALTEAIRRAGADTVELAVRSAGDATIWELRGLDESIACEEGHVRGFGVSQALLEVYGGRFWAEVNGRGSTVLCFTVPAGRPKTILVVDDDADTVGLFRRYLQPPQYDLRVARDRDELQAAVAGVVPDLILLDVIMPEEDGWDILQHLKIVQRTAAIPVVICSVLNEPHLAFALGADLVLQKPIDQEVLLRTVQKLLESPDRRDEPRPTGPANTSSL